MNPHLDPDHETRPPDDGAPSGPPRSFLADDTPDAGDLSVAEVEALARSLLDATREIDRRDVESELERVLRHETASLLRQAAGLRVVEEPQYEAFGYPVPPQSRQAWRRRVRSTLGRAAHDGWVSRGADTLASLLARPMESWPRASRLADAARRVEDGEFARLCLGHALLCEGESGRAEAVFADLLRRGHVLRHRWRVLAGLALAHESLGRPGLALGAIEAAVGEPWCGVEVFVQGLHQALWTGDADRARRAAARLDLLVDPHTPDFAAALGRLRARLEASSASSPPLPTSVRDLLEDLARTEGSPAGSVVRALV